MSVNCCVSVHFVVIYKNKTVLQLEKYKTFVYLYLWGFIFKINNTWLDHFMIQIISLSSSLSNTSKHWVTTMSFGNIVNQFHDKNSLSNTCSTEETLQKIKGPQCKKSYSSFMLNVLLTNQFFHP